MALTATNEYNNTNDILYIFKLRTISILMYNVQCIFMLFHPYFIFQSFKLGMDVPGEADENVSSVTV